MNPFNKKRNYIEFSGEDIANDIRNIVIDKLQNYIPKKLRNRSLLNFLNDLKNTFLNLKKILPITKKETKDTIINLAVLTQVYECIDIINLTIKEYNKNKNINVHDFLKKLKNTDEEEEEYEEDSVNEDETSNKNKNDEKNEDDGNDDDDDEDGDDDDGDDDDFKNYMREAGKRRKLNEEDNNFQRELIKSSINDNNSNIVNYFSSKTKIDKLDLLNKLKEINNYQSVDSPLFFKILSMKLDLGQKNHILKKYLSVVNSREGNSKVKNWVDSVMKIPFGVYKGIDLNMKSRKINGFLQNLKNTMDDAVWGHDETKNQIIQIMAQQIRNPNSKGNVLGIYGPPGNGKSTIIKEGISKALNKPFVFISLGGASDGSFLEGHGFTYEGSIYGRIANGLITSGCMNPIIYFDELDKISNTPRGNEIINILIHITDPVQNNHFRDRYFHGIDIDLSKVTFIFSYNDPSLVDRVLLDRITQIETKALNSNQKVHIAQKYLLPEILKEVGLEKDSITFNNDIIKSLIDKYTREGGVRKLKQYFYNIIRELNIQNLTKKLDFPHKISNNDILLILKNKREIESEKIHSESRVGIINGLYADSHGAFGGVMPIEIMWIPASKPLEIKATGNLQLVIKESTQVASTLAFNYLDQKKQDEYLKIWSSKPKGLHIHVPEGAVAKDGPSAGTAIAVAIYSILLNKSIRNDIAITGEINLKGQVTEIGGLENKLEGAKKAGVKLVLCPKENEKDLEKIIEKNETLVNDNFKVICIETLKQAIEYSLLD
jgi:endopeptidase La